VGSVGVSVIFWRFALDSEVQLSISSVRGLWRFVWGEAVSKDATRFNSGKVVGETKGMATGKVIIGNDRGWGGLGDC